MTEARRGVFISFEGSDGCGKTTQMRRLVERLREEGQTVVESVEPGGTPIGVQIRRILLDAANRELAPMAELLLMFASRAQAVEQWIRPALERGEIVVSDRFTDSTLAYQGEARGLGFDAVLALHKLALGDLLPDVTICVDLDLETSMARAKRRNRRTGANVPNETRLDSQSVEFHQRVRDGYRKIAALYPTRFRVIDGSSTPDEVADKVRAAIVRWIPRARKL